MSARTVVRITVAVVFLLVLVYTYVLLPLEFGLGLAGGYEKIGAVGPAGVLLIPWIALAIWLGWALGRRADLAQSKLRTALFATLAGSLILVTSHPLVVMAMYLAVDYSGTPIAPFEQIVLIAVASRVYTWSLALSVIAIIASIVLLVVLRNRGRASGVDPG